LEVGIATPAQLRKLGPEEAWRRLRFAFGKRVTVNFIYALEAAITGQRWKDLKPGRKARLKAAAEAIRLATDG
ncbi:MAG TPA: TfoX/Sxy family DNA transformation protein, partial [Hyphomonadaceae bacterium]|nr:TfoX/Sxy family DNA transformation protein [Hyphomonadaceae bacterium]